jgi:hypothetical protein
MEHKILIQGGCYCGAIRYQVECAPFDETHCHCSICRRTSGAPFVTWFSVTKSSFQLLAGTPAQFQSTATGLRTFCPQCGTPLTFQSADLPDEIDITTCSLDAPELVPPKDHTRTSSKLPWIVLNDSLPVYPESRYSH